MADGAEAAIVRWCSTRGALGVEAAEFAEPMKPIGTGVQSVFPFQGSGSTANNFGLLAVYSASVGTEKDCGGSFVILMRPGGGLSMLPCNFGLRYYGLYIVDYLHGNSFLFEISIDGGVCFLENIWSS